MESEKKDALQEWMVRLADGDRGAFDPLYELLWPLVRRFADRALNGSPEADDVAQVALMKVFARAEEFDRERDALSWILGIAAYECRTLRQKQRRRREAPGIHERGIHERGIDQRGIDQRELAGSETLRNDESRSPEDAAIERNLEAAALEALGTLRPRDIETLRAVMDGKRPEVPPPTFRKRVERAVSRLRAAWSSRHGLD